jgi:hypothetical protein
MENIYLNDSPEKVGMELRDEDENPGFPESGNKIGFKSREISIKIAILFFSSIRSYVMCQVKSQDSCVKIKNRK